MYFRQANGENPPASCISIYFTCSFTNRYLRKLKTLALQKAPATRNMMNAEGIYSQRQKELSNIQAEGTTNGGKAFFTCRLPFDVSYSV
jgi:hypothetical protein